MDAEPTGEYALLGMSWGPFHDTAFLRLDRERESRQPVRDGIDPEYVYGEKRDGKPGKQGEEKRPYLARVGSEEEFYEIPYYQPRLTAFSMSIQKTCAVRSIKYLFKE